MKRTIILIATTASLVLAPAAQATEPTSVVPVTETPTTTVTEVPATTVTEVPTTTTVTDVPTTTTTTETPVTACVTDCIPENVDTCVACVPTTGAGVPTAVGGAGALPFTGIEDTIAPILLALTVLLGGVVAWRWAQLRESVARDASQRHITPTRDSRTGFAPAMRQYEIERRARQVFTPRVA